MLKVLGRDRGSSYELTLSGTINESSELRIDGLPSGRSVVIDAGGIARINSMGIRNWTNFISAVCLISTSVVIKRLPPRLVAQANMVKNFLDHATVESFYVPYCCEECGHECLELFEALAHIPAELPCPECGDAMLFDEIPETYLAFRSDAEEADTLHGMAPIKMEDITAASWF